jgi:titin
LVNGQEYAVWVWADGGDGITPSDERHATPMAPTPAPTPAPETDLDPPVITHIEGRDASIYLMWSAVEGATGYQYGWDLVDASGAGGSGVVPGGGTSHTITGLVNGQEYAVWVWADGRDEVSDSRSATPMAPTPAPTPAPETDPAPDPEAPSAPTDVMVEAGDMMLMVTWDKPEEGASAITGYSVQYRPVGADWIDHDHEGLVRETTIEGLVSPARASRPSTPARKGKGLVNDARYQVQVAAMNDAGMGPYSEPESGTPMATEVVPTPALPFFGALALAGALAAAGRRRMRQFRARRESRMIQ